jgi:hypothetical protein
VICIMARLRIHPAPTMVQLSKRNTSCPCLYP